MEQISRFYSGWADIYDALYDVQGQNDDIPFLLKLIGESGGPVLECACGTGRVMIPIAEKGFRVHGIDASEEMLDVLKKKIAKLGKDARNRISYERGDIRDFGINRKFRTCLIAFNSLYHLEKDSEIMDFLSCANNHLETGGHLIIDVFEFDPSLVKNSFVLQGESELPDRSRVRKYHRTASWKGQINKCEFKIVREKGGRERVTIKKFKLHYLFYGQLWKMLEGSGFRVRSVYADYDCTPYREGEQNKKMIFVSEKI